MTIKSGFLMGLGGLLGSRLICSWMRTLDYRVLYHDPASDPASPACRGQKIYLFWHEYILFPLFQRRHCNLAMLLSRHPDAEVLSQIARQMGFAFVRGSTNRGGVSALRELFRKSRRMHLTITPDGPRGPRRRMSLGPIYLASRLEMPLVLLGFAYDRPWRFRKAWDRFAVPRPFSRGRAVVAPEMHVPPDLPRSELEAYRRRAEMELNRVTEEAEDWAESGAPRAGQMRLIPGPFQPLLARVDAAHASHEHWMHAPPKPVSEAFSVPERYVHGPRPILI